MALQKAQPDHPDSKTAAKLLIDAAAEEGITVEQLVERINLIDAAHCGHCGAAIATAAQAASHQCQPPLIAPNPKYPD